MLINDFLSIEFQKLLSKDQKTKFLTLIKTAFKDFKLDPNKKSFAHGGRAKVYLDPRDSRKLIRFDFIPPQTRVGIQKYLQTIDQVYQRIPACMPRLYQKKEYISGFATKFGVLVTVVERLDIIDWRTNWQKFFKSDVELIQKLFLKLLIMKLKHVLHRDISYTNVVLTKTGDIKFIDLEDACVVGDQNQTRTFCIFPKQTPGFQAPEFAISGEDYSEYNRQEMSRVFGITLPQVANFQQYRGTQGIWKNSIYSMGALCYEIITKQDARRLNFKLIKNPISQKLILRAMHPNPETRDLLFLKKKIEPVKNPIQKPNQIQCQATTKKGMQCKKNALKGKKFCNVHSK